MSKHLRDITIKLEVSDDRGISLSESVVMKGRNIDLNGELLQAMAPLVRNLNYELAKQLFNQLDDA